MFGERRIRALLGPADPARARTITPPRLEAHDLIALAESTPDQAETRRTGPTRRLVLVAGTAVVTAGAVVVVDRLLPSNVDEPGLVLEPTAYEFDSGATDAAPHLRDLADNLTGAPYENRSGRFTYHHTRSWGYVVTDTADGRYRLAFAQEKKDWWAYDATGRAISTPRPPEFPDEQTREAWARDRVDLRLPPTDFPVEPAGPATVLPSDRGRLTVLLEVTKGAYSVFREFGRVYERHAVPRSIRAELLRILADDVPGLLWRGRVGDRAGRPGVAVTFDDHGAGRRYLWLLHPGTGELLAVEELALAPSRLRSYELFLRTDRTDHIG